jgi:metallo-beta-lactamase family protein
VELLFRDAGHILGSASVTLRLKREDGSTCVFGFTGDIGRPNRPILRDPEPIEACDYLICESTYGDRLHEAEQDAEAHLLRIVRETCVERSGKLIIPAFSIDRTQELIYMLDRLAYAKKLPSIPVYVDSPLSVNATEIMAKHRQCFNAEILEYITRDGNPFSFPNLHYISKVEESKALNDNKGPAIIISASGMAEAGRVKHHIKNHIEDPDSTILIVGYATPHSLAGQLKARNEKVKIFGDLHTILCRVEVMDSFSAHADYREMLDYLKSQVPERVQHTFLVHGNERALQAWQSRLLDHGFRNITIAKHGQTYDC